MFQTIMVAIGASPWSRNAVEAIRLATALNQELIITHVLDDELLFDPPGSETIDSELLDQIEVAAHDILERAAQMAQPVQVSVRTVLKRGDIAEQIVKAAITSGCDLIVMGTRHLSGDKRLMTGQICNAVIATSPCPVLVVPLVQLGRSSNFG